MKTPFTLSEKIIASILFVIGVFLSYQAIEGYIYSYIIYYISPDSYRILVSTYVSNLVNGNLLILSSLLFFKKKILGALAFQFTGIMLILYAINFSLYDLIAYDTYDVFVDTVIIMTLLTLGLLIYFYFKRRNLLYRNRSIFILFIIIAIIIYIYINLFFCDWSMFAK